MVVRALKLHGQALLTALQFLTRLPIPATVPFEKPIIVRSVLYFPVAGAAIAFCLTAAQLLLSAVLPPWPAAVLLLALWVALSGGLHLDGWMDTADGVLSHRPREAMLRIMKDSRVGAMGVAAAVLLLLLKASLLAALLEDDAVGGTGMSVVLVCAVCWSRAWLALAIAGWPSAREGEGMAALFSGVGRPRAVLSLAIAAFILLITLIINGISYREWSLWLLASFVLTATVGGAMARWLAGKLGGLTGDTYGAMNEAIEAVILLAAVVWLHD